MNVTACGRADLQELDGENPAALRSVDSTSTLPLDFARGAPQSDVNCNEVVTSTVRSRSSPYGEYRVTPTSDLTDKGFTGHAQNDEVALIYMRARYYVPGVGRFASADSIVPDPLNPQSFNRYSYVFNNPLVFSDFTGHGPITDWLTEIGQQSSLARSLIVGTNAVVTHINQQTEKIFYPDANTDQGDRLLACAEIGGGSVLFAATATEVAFGTLTTAATTGGTVTVGTATGTTVTTACADGDCTNELTAAAKTASSVIDKLTRYLLNPNHPRGSTMATWYERALGFTQENMGNLAKQIVFDPNTAYVTEVTQFGTKYNQVIPITGANDKVIDVLVAWIELADGTIKLVTTVPGQ